MQPTVLETIVQTKTKAIALKKKTMPLSMIQQNLQPSDRDFYAALATQKQQNKPVFILECKKASPSKGLLRPDFNVEDIAHVYKHYAQVISVLTEETFFQGDYANLSKVRTIATQPILCKDFIVDPYQIYLARYYGADAILLMLSVLTQVQYKELVNVAHSLNMGVLTEVINQQEVDIAVKNNAKVIGINNRDLRDLTVDLNVTKKLAPAIPADRIIISESGIKTNHHVRELSDVADGFLIGSALMGEKDLNTAVRKIIYGEHKICGLMRPDDARQTYASGFIYGGFIFVQSSPRYISAEQAQAIQLEAPLLQYVGVFQNEEITHVVRIAKALNLHAIQLHGQEDDIYIQELKQVLPPECQIWKALSVKTSVPETNHAHVDTYVLDGANAGSGQLFNWSLLYDKNLNNVMIAGGLNYGNCLQALRFYPKGLDFNSGVEMCTENNSVLKYKDHQKIRQLSEKLQQNI